MVATRFRGNGDIGHMMLCLVPDVVGPVSTAEKAAPKVSLNDLAVEG